MRIYGDGGWVRFEREPGVPGTVYLKFDQNFQLVELHVDGAGRDLSAGDLRALPLARLKATALGRHDILSGLLGLEGGNASPDPDVRGQLEAACPPAARQNVDRSARLSPPSASGYTDGFLGDVANAYLAAVARGERPNVSLAKQVGKGYSRRTVERWVYIARRRGFLPPTTPGNVA